MSAHQACYPIATMCRVLEVFPSGYYAWSQRSPPKSARQYAKLCIQVEAIHSKSRGSYGVPRIHAELQENGVRVGRKWVARLMS